MPDKEFTVKVDLLHHPEVQILADRLKAVVQVSEEWEASSKNYDDALMLLERFSCIVNK